MAKPDRTRPQHETEATDREPVGSREAPPPQPPRPGGVADAPQTAQSEEGGGPAGFTALETALKAAVLAKTPHAKWEVVLDTRPEGISPAGSEELVKARQEGDERASQAAPGSGAPDRRRGAPLGLTREQTLTIDRVAENGTRTGVAFFCGACRAAFPGEGAAGHSHRRQEVVQAEQAAKGKRTELPPGEELRFRRWYSDHRAEWALPVDPDEGAPGVDLRGVFQSGETPRRGADGRVVWPDRFTGVGEAARVRVAGAGGQRAQQAESEAQATDRRGGTVDQPGSSG